jgi:hypothetical protein
MDGWRGEKVGCEEVFMRFFFVVELGRAEVVMM